jgi:hypothetical protein
LFGELNRGEAVGRHEAKVDLAFGGGALVLAQIADVVDVGNEEINGACDFSKRDRVSVVRGLAKNEELVSTFGGDATAGGKERVPFWVACPGADPLGADIAAVSLDTPDEVEGMVSYRAELGDADMRLLEIADCAFEMVAQVWIDAVYFVESELQQGLYIPLEISFCAK